MYYETYQSVLKPEKTMDLKDLLTNLGYHGITTKHTFGYGESKKIVKQVYRGKVYEQRVDAVKREELEFVVADYRVKSVVESIGVLLKLMKVEMGEYTYFL